MPNLNVIDLPINKRKETDTSTEYVIPNNILLSMMNQLSEVSAQNNYIIELINDQVKNKSLNSESQYLTKNAYDFSQFIDEKFTSPKLTTNTLISKQDVSVKLHTILMVGSIFFGFICLAGLSTWLISDVIILNPFASILGLIASPFFYLMGKIAKNA